MSIVKIVIDTNVYLNFYRSKKESLEVLEKIKKLNSHLLFPTLIYDEFLRNRNSVLQELIDLYDYHNLNLQTSALIQDLRKFKELNKIAKDFKQKAKEVQQKLTELKNNPESDKIYNCVYEIFNSDKVTKIGYDNEIIDLANERHLLGKPPGSDKVTICDEIIWECLIKKSESNLILVTNDKSFITYNDYLKNEFKRRNGNELKGITEKITDAFKLIKVSVKEALEKIENEMLQHLRKVKESGRQFTLTDTSTGKVYVNPNLDTISHLFFQRLEDTGFTKKSV